MPPPSALTPRRPTAYEARGARTPTQRASVVGLCTLMLASGCVDTLPSGTNGPHQNVAQHSLTQSPLKAPPSDTSADDGEHGCDIGDAEPLLLVEPAFDDNDGLALVSDSDTLALNVQCETTGELRASVLLAGEGGIRSVDTIAESECVAGEVSHIGIPVSLMPWRETFTTVVQAPSQLTATVEVSVPGLGVVGEATTVLYVQPEARGSTALLVYDEMRRRELFQGGSLEPARQAAIRTAVGDLVVGEMRSDEVGEHTVVARYAGEATVFVSDTPPANEDRARIWRAER